MGDQLFGFASHLLEQTISVLIYGIELLQLDISPCATVS